MRHSGLFLVALAAALWATVGVATGVVPEGSRWPDELLALSRPLLAGPILLGFAFVRHGALRARLAALGPADLVRFAVACAVFQICLFRSFSLIGVTDTVFLTVGLPPLFAVLWSRSTGREPVTTEDVLSLALATIGLYLLCESGLTVGQGGVWLSGLGLCVLASIAFVIMSKAARRLGERAPAPVVAGAGLTLAGCMILPFVLVAGATGLLHLEDLPLAAPSLVLVGYLALLPTALAYILFTVGMARCRTATVGVIAVMIEPAIAAFLAVCLLGERLGAAQVLGCTLLVGSISMLVGDFPRLRRHDRAAARPGDPVLVADAGAADNRPDIANAERPVSSDWRGKDAA